MMKEEFLKRAAEMFGPDNELLKNISLMESPGSTVQIAVRYPDIEDKSRFYILEKREGKIAASISIRGVEECYVWNL